MHAPHACSFQHTPHNQGAPGAPRCSKGVSTPPEELRLSGRVISQGLQAYTRITNNTALLTYRELLIAIAAPDAADVAAAPDAVAVAAAPAAAAVAPDAGAASAAAVVAAALPLNAGACASFQFKLNIF